MLKKWLSRYNLRYPRSLVYMLQASEYNLRDYFTWYCHVRDFTRVEKRKQLVKTAKAYVLLIAGWLMVIVWGAAALAALFINHPLKYFLFLAMILLSPYLLAYVIILPLLIIKVFQPPIEYWLVRQAREKIKNHKAVKICVAGSFGKTTMREILKKVLSEGKKVAAAPHNFNTPLGLAQFIQTLKGDEEVLIFELGEYYPGDIRKLCLLTQPDIGVITGINEAHLQKFKSLERTAKTIYELADYLGEKPLYVNGENELARQNARPQNIVYDRKHIDGWATENARTGLDGTFFSLIKNGARLELCSKLLGLHQIGPLAAAVHIALNLDLSFNQIMAGMSRTKPFEHRLEPKEKDGVVTIDDSYNGNPDGVMAAIEFLASLEGRRRFYVTPGLVEMGARAQEVHREIGQNLAGAQIEKVVLIKNSVTPFIEQGLREKNYGGEVLRFDEVLSTFAALPNLTAQGDVVLLQNDWPDQYQ